jgi:hypothetical protein
MIDKGLLDEMFQKYGWHKCRNEIDTVSYTKFGKETEYFEVRIDKSKVYVTIPIKNSPYQFTTSFNNYDEANNYIDLRFKDFVL